MPDRFYLRWILANAVAEGVGLGATMFLAFGSGPGLNPNSVFLMLSAAALAVLWGVLIEGVLLGALQAWAIHAEDSKLPIRQWIIATAIGAGIAWMLGMLPSTIMGIASLNEPIAPAPVQPSEPPAWLQLVLAAAMGMVLGPILGFAQSRVLRRALKVRCHWLFANALAWAVGMPLIFLGMNFVPWQSGSLAIFAAVFAVCLIAGAAVGAVHGLFLRRALRPRDVRA
jgi:hypothetical protein